MNEQSRPRVDADVMYQQLMETVRAQYSSLVTESTILSLILVTMVGFAIEKQSWGVALAALMVYPAKLFMLRGWRNQSRRLLRLATELEPTSPSLSAVLLKPDGGFTGRHPHWWLVIAVGVMHLGFLASLLSRDGWSFGGS